MNDINAMYMCAHIIFVWGKLGRNISVVRAGVKGAEIESTKADVRLLKVAEQWRNCGITTLFMCDTV